MIEHKLMLNQIPKNEDNLELSSPSCINFHGFVLLFWALNFNFE
jgi:hypothetical protein